MYCYLDNAATTKVCPEAAQTAYKIMTEIYGNPSSTHTMGREAKAALNLSRSQVASAIGAKPEEIFFTSCGSESDNWAIISGAESMKRHGKHVISSMGEHNAVLRSLEVLENRGFEVTLLRPQKDGSIAPEDVAEALREDTVLVSLMLVNNETGGITDIAAISRILKSKDSKALLHTDAVQGFLKVPFTAKSLGADMISLSGHKIHAPKGIGALYIKGGMKNIKLKPLIVGGAQESGKRAGTEPLPQIAAMGKAARLGFECRDSSISLMNSLKEHAISRLTAENDSLLVLSGDAPHILSISIPGYKSEVLMNFLESRGVFVSKSSACKKGARSHVLEAMGLPPRVIDGALRISFSHYSTLEETDALCDGIRAALKAVLPVLGK